MLRLLKVYTLCILFIIFFSCTKKIIIPAQKDVFLSSNIPDKNISGKDIYMLKRVTDGVWSEPEKLGSQINTPYDEEFPFIHPNGKTFALLKNTK